MVIVSGLLSGYLIGKCITVVGGFIYNRTTGRKNEQKWNEFIELYRRLKAEEQTK